MGVKKLWFSNTVKEYLKNKHVVSWKAHQLLRLKIMFTRHWTWLISQ